MTAQANDDGVPSSSSRIGVVIPVYNRAQTLLKTLEFVVAQTRPADRLVIVDDGSSDETPDAAEQWLAKRPRPFAWQVIRAPHRTAAAARNTGFDEIQAHDYVAFLDSDDHWPPDFLARTAALLDQQPTAVAVTTDRQSYNELGDIWKTDSSGLASDAVRWLFSTDAGIASCSLFRSSVIRQAGGWSESLESGEDFVLFLAVAQLGAWVHAAGHPVRFNRASAATTGEEGNLSLRRLEMYREWALQYERSFAEIDEADRRRRRDLKCGVARKWRDAGMEFLRRRRPTEAADAFAAALRWNPRLLGLRIRLLQARLSARRRRSPRRQAAAEVAPATPES